MAEKNIVAKPPEFLLKEYEHFSQSLHKNEELGERRIHFFISLTTVVIAGVITLLTYEFDSTCTKCFFQNSEKLKAVVSLLLSGILILGLVTFVRLMRRNFVTDAIKKRLKYLSDELNKEPYGLAGYKAFELKPWFFTGGLADTMASMNSFILTSIFWVNYQVVKNSILTFIVSFILQVMIAYLIREFNRNTPETNTPETNTPETNTPETND